MLCWYSTDFSLYIGITQQIFIRQIADSGNIMGENIAKQEDKIPWLVLMQFLIG